MGRRLGPYTLVHQIAVGGMAEIYLATTRDGDQPEQRVAIKVIHPQNADDPEFVRMLIDEARLAVLLHHPNIVATYDLGQEKGQYYIVMELVEGADLFKVLRRTSERDIDFPFELAAYVAKEVATGLDYAHRKRDDRGRPLQIVHRDISPQNVLLSHESEVKIVDFGIAKAAHRAAQTQAGVIKGKYYYMSPEQAWGDPIDARTDIFSAGILLYEMLVGQMLYLEEDFERLLDLVRKAEIPPPSTKRRGIPRDLEQIVMKALRKRPSDRWPTAGDYAQALTDFLRGYAPSFNPAQLGSFVQGVISEAPARRRAPNEATAALARPRYLLDSSATGDFSVRDQNSLLFQVGDVEAAVAEERSASPSAAAAPRGEDFGEEETHVDDGIEHMLSLFGPGPGAEPDSAEPAPRLSMSRLDEDPIDLEPTSIADEMLPAIPSPGRPELPGVRMAARGPDPLAGKKPETYTAERKTAPVLPLAGPSPPSPSPAREFPAPAGRAPQRGRSIPRPAPAAPPRTNPGPVAQARNLVPETPGQGPGGHEPVPAVNKPSAPEKKPISAPIRPPSGTPRPAPPPSLPPAPPPSVATPVYPQPPPGQDATSQAQVIGVPWPAATTPRPPWPTERPGSSSGSGMKPKPAAWPDQVSSLDVASLSSGWSQHGVRPERKRRGLVLAFLVAMVLGAGGVTAVVLWPESPYHGQLEINSAPQGAVVTIDGHRVETPTPVKIVDLDTRMAHHVTVAQPGYRDWETELRFDPTEQARAVQAILSPAGGEAVVESTPPGADVLVGSQSRGQTPVTLRGLPLEKDLELILRLPGHKQLRYSEGWHGRRSMTVRVVLERVSR